MSDQSEILIFSSGGGGGGGGGGGIEVIGEPSVLVAPFEIHSIYAPQIPYKWAPVGGG